MRKKIIICVIAALCLFVGASPWEGAAATAPEGELPGNGRYIATNSFPRNTVVDIVNIETNKSTRVIVANNLDSPGLLAIVSREAAELIGMRPGSVSRIRMTQPSDPVAYVRFTEGLSSGLTDYDSGDVITEEKYNEEFVNPSAPPSVPAGGVPAAPAVPPPAPLAAAPDAGYPAYVLEPEWSGAKSRRDIVDLPPEYAAPQIKPETPPPFLTNAPETPPTDLGGNPEEIAGTEPADKHEEIAGTEPAIEDKTTEEIDEKTAEAESDEPVDVIEKVADAKPADEVKKDETPGKTAEIFPEDDYGAVAEYEPDDVYYEDDFIKERDAIAEAEETPEDDYFDKSYDLVEYDIVPTDDRPPASIYGIDPSYIIPGISNAAKPDASKPETKPETPVKTNTFNDPNFSAPRIYELARGQYYVQLASFDSAESVQSSINRIDQHYEPKVYKDGDKWYRILLGPLNQGESAAVLARFKSIGYKDAFVRVAR
jgi:hypothetical protein